MLSNFLSSSALALLLCGSMAAAQLNRPVAAQEDALEVYYNKFWDLTKNVPATVTQWPLHSMPLSCAEQANKAGIAAKLVTAYSVTYADVSLPTYSLCPLQNTTMLTTVAEEQCAEPWVICRVGTPALSLERQVRILGRVPVKARAHIRHMIALPAMAGKYAHASGKDVAFFVDIPSFATMIHELTHVLDNGKSDSAAWKNAVAQDSCVITEYANKSYVENLACIAPLVLLHVLDQPAFMDARNKLGLGCLAKQYAYIHDKFDTIFTPGGSCPRRVTPNSPTVDR